MSDQEIITAIQSGQHSKALKKLYAYFSPVRQLVLNNNGTKQDAEDIYQEGLIILFRKVKEKEFSLSSSLNTFLYGICRLLWHDELKKRNRMPHASSEFTDEIAADDELDAILLREENYRKAEAAFMLIGEKCRELLQFFYFRKMSMNEIAVKLGFSAEQVAKNQKFRCLEKAKEHLKKMITEKVLS